MIFSLPYCTVIMYNEEIIMKQVTYTEARQNLSDLINIAYDDCVPVYITRKNGARVVLVNADDYDAMDETQYLYRNKANLRHLESAIRNLR